MRIIHEWRGEHAGDEFGWIARGIGDVDGDGVTDVVVSATTNAPYGSTHGKVHVYSGRSGRLLWRRDGEPGWLLGTSLEAAGDVDGDAVPDIFASDFANAAKGPSTGRVYVYSGATGQPVLALTGDAAGEALGTSASRAGDVDGDGRADLAVGAWQYGGAAWSGGRVTVYSGRDGHVLQRFTGRIPGETLGFDAVGIGDVDGDGLTDFLVTSAYSLVHGPRSGRVYVVAGTR